ncbi:ABC transporter ATP-binding protein [Rhodococcus koreensis]
MTHLVLENITKVYGANTVVDDISLSIDEGESVVLLGPSGCGKTTCLRMIAGFERPQSGSIRLGSTTLVDDKLNIPTEKRKMSVMFQSYALWPHMKVFDNIAYGPRTAKVAKPEVARRVREALELVQLPQISDRYIHQLSGGQQQRVALARALVNEPKVLLLDEPLSNLDTRLREEMRTEIRRIQRSLGVTMIYVTHDQAEALSLADRLVVMNTGHIEQIGSPEMVYRHPRTGYVAKALGTTNILDAEVLAADEGVTMIRPFDGVVVPATVPDGMRVASGDTVSVSVRPAQLSVQPSERGSGNAIVTEASFFGDHTAYVVRPQGIGGGAALVRATGSPVDRQQVGDLVQLSISDTAVAVLTDNHRSAASPAHARPLQLS